MHDISLITTIALGLSAALVLGLLAKRLGLSPIVGYLLAGITLSPHTPGFVGDVKIAAQLSELGVMLLMFGVGLHFHLKDLLAVRSIAIPGALGQSAAATLACMGIAIALGMTWQNGLVLGVAVSVASTVVLLRALTESGRLETTEGHVAVGWLVVEDLLTVLVLVLLPPLAAGDEGDASLLKTAGLATAKLVLLSAIILLAGARFVPWLFVRVTRLRSRELFTLAVLVMAICVATVSYVAFGASMALGAFLAGMVVGQSKVSHQAAAEIVPLRDAFAVLFFVAVGMLFDYRAVLEAPLLLVGVTAVILIIKPLIALVIALVCGHSLRTGLTVAGGLAQIGEFSFILGEVAKSLGLLPGSAHNVLVAAAIISISLNPVLFRKLLALEPKLARWPLLARWLAHGEKRRGLKATQPAPTLVETAGTRAIVVGFGPVGQTLTRLLRESGMQPTIIETNVDTVLELQAAGQQAVFGDATHRAILEAAGLKSATYLVVTVPKLETSLAIIQAAREVNPELRVLARAAYLNQRATLEQAGAALVRSDEAEAAVALAGALLQEIQIRPRQIKAAIATVRQELEAKPIE